MSNLRDRIFHKVVNFQPKNKRECSYEERKTAGSMAKLLTDEGSILQKAPQTSLFLYREQL